MITKYAVKYFFYVPDDDYVYGNDDTQTILGEFDTYAEAEQWFPALYDDLEYGCQKETSFYDAVCIIENYYEDEDSDEFIQGKVLYAKFPEWVPDDARQFMNNWLSALNEISEVYE